MVERLNPIIIGVIGSSGSGKSFLLNLLMGKAGNNPGDESAFITGKNN